MFDFSHTVFVALSSAFINENRENAVCFGFIFCLCVSLTAYLTVRTILGFFSISFAGCNNSASEQMELFLQSCLIYS